MVAINIEQAKLDPAHFFKSPMEVIKNKDLTREEMIDILRSWEYDERELAVAEEENMPVRGSEERNQLDKILKALLRLKSKHEIDPIAPTKQGG
jgi:hypothetical protein